jgi:hypothetical protein
MTTTPVQHAVQSHVALWNAMDRESWVKLFSSQMVFEDPVGTPEKVGVDAVYKSWDRSFKPGRRWTLHPEHVVAAGNEAAVVMRNEGDLNGQKVTIRSIEIFVVDDSGLLVRIRSFFDQPTDFALSDYFTPDRTE